MKAPSPVKAPKVKAPKVKAPKMKAPKVEAPVKSPSASGCIKSTDKKYQTRPSPPYPAALCPNTVKVGNNGKMFKTVLSAKGVWRWVPVA